MKIVFTFLIQKIKSFFVNFSVKDLIYLSSIICLIMLLLNRSGKQGVNTAIIKPTLSAVHHETDKKGNSYTEVKGIIYTQEQMDFVTDSFRKVLKKGKVVAVEQEVASAKTYTVTVPVYINTAKSTIFSRDSNKNYSQTFMGSYKSGTGFFSLTIAQDVATHVTTFKNHLFGPTDMNVITYHTNELFAADSAFAYTEEIPKVVAVIGPSTGLMYDGKIHPYIGAGITFNVFSLKRRHHHRH